MTAPTYAPALLQLVAAPGPLTHKLLWRALAPAEKKLAARELLADTDSPWAKAAVVDALAKVNKGFRRPTIAAWPAEKMADELSRRPLDDLSLIDSLLKSLHFPGRAHIQAAFFDAAGIPHTDGVVEGDTLAQPAATPEVVRGAAASLLTSHPGDPALFYLLCISALEPLAWPTLHGALRELVPAA